jgi:hypothetical protein
LPENQNGRERGLTGRGCKPSQRKSGARESIVLSHRQTQAALKTNRFAIGNGKKISKRARGGTMTDQVIVEIL